MSLRDRIGEAISYASRERGRAVTQAEIAAACGIRPPSVSNWLSGETKSLRGETAILAARYLGVSPAWLARGEGAMIATEASDRQSVSSLRVRSSSAPSLTVASAPTAAADLVGVLQDIQRAAAPLDAERRGRLVADVRKVLDAYR